MRVAAIVLGYQAEGIPGARAEADAWVIAFTETPLATQTWRSLPPRRGLSTKNGARSQFDTPRSFAFEGV